MKKHHTRASLIALFILALPHMGMAYFTTDQFALRLDEKSVLYGITYSFGSNRYEYTMPIIPERKGGSDDQSRTLTYAIFEEDDGEIDYGNSTGVVLSGAEIRNDMYVVPRGESRRFTLLVLLTGSSIPSKTLELGLGVTNLPFTMIHVDGETNGQLNPSELEKYITPYVDIPG